MIKKIEEERLADPSGTLKEDDSDMNKVLKEIEDMDKDQTKKNNEIFSVMQGPSTNNEFDFLNIFETSPVVVQKNDSSLATNNTTQISNNDNLQQNTTTNIGTGNKNPIFIPEISTQKTNLGQKIDSNFDFLSEIDGSNKPFHTSLKPKSQNQGLFNQTVQMKKMQAPPTNINFNNNLNENNYNVSNNDKNQNNAQNLFNNLNLNPKSNMISYGNQQQPIINNSTTLKGNMLNLNYDPFSEIDIKRHSFDQNPNNSNKIVNNVFSGEPIDLSSDFKKTQTNNKPTLSQNSKKNENDSGWNFDDFQNLNINSGKT